MVLSSHDIYLKVTTVHRLIKVIKREGRIYKSEAYRRCGKGLTEAEFDGVIGYLLTQHPWLQVEKGPNGADVLILHATAKDSGDPKGETNAEYLPEDCRSSS